MTGGGAFLPASLDPYTSLGLLAACLTTGAYFPQAVKTWRTRSTEDISLLTIAALVTGQLLWLAYGLMRLDVALIVANAISSMLTSSILYVKARNGGN